MCDVLGGPKDHGHQHDVHNEQGRALEVVALAVCERVVHQQAAKQHAPQVNVRKHHGELHKKEEEEEEERKKERIEEKSEEEERKKNRRRKK